MHGDNNGVDVIRKTSSRVGTSARSEELSREVCCDSAGNSATLSSLILRRRGLVGGKVLAWPGSRGKAPGDPRTTTDSWASPDCSVSGAAPAVAPGRRAEGVINATSASLAFCVVFFFFYVLFCY